MTVCGHDLHQGLSLHSAKIGTNTHILYIVLHTEVKVWQWKGQIHVARKPMELFEAENPELSASFRWVFLYLAENLQVFVLVQVQHASWEVCRNCLSAHLNLKLFKWTEIIRQIWEVNFHHNFGAAGIDQERKRTAFPLTDFKIKGRIFTATLGVCCP